MATQQTNTHSYSPQNTRTLELYARTSYKHTSCNIGWVFADTFAVRRVLSSGIIFIVIKKKATASIKISNLCLLMCGGRQPGQGKCVQGWLGPAMTAHKQKLYSVATHTHPAIRTRSKIMSNVNIGTATQKHQPPPSNHPTPYLDLCRGQKNRRARVARCRRYM